MTAPATMTTTTMPPSTPHTTPASSTQNTSDAGTGKAATTGPAQEQWPDHTTIKGGSNISGSNNGTHSRTRAALGGMTGLS